MINIAILGCTGSIGTTTLGIIRQHREKFNVVLLANNANECRLFELAKEFDCKNVYCQKSAEDKGFLTRAETYQNCDLVVNGISGTDGLLPAYAVIEGGKKLLTANKECLVCAGYILTKLAKKTGAEIIPLDSEHSAVLQCIYGREEEVKNIILTCSGGALYSFDKDSLAHAKAKDALIHPTWKMGKKVTIDCATLVNKGFELIEAKHLFGTENISAVRHKESIIHAIVELKDNSCLSLLSNPSMVLPIQYALLGLRHQESNIKAIDFIKNGSLHFEPIDEDRFICFTICKNILKKGDKEGTILATADEIAVQYYLQDKISFYQISDMIQDCLQKFNNYRDITDIKEVLSLQDSIKEYILESFQYNNI